MQSPSVSPVPERFVTYPEAMRRLGVKSRVTLFNWQRSGDLPPARRIGPNRRGWLESEFTEFMRTREPAQ